jgi:hypothetical protein
MGSGCVVLNDPSEERVAGDVKVSESVVVVYLSRSLKYEVIGQGSLRVAGENSLCGFISRGIKKNWEMFGLLEFVRLDYCSADSVSNFWWLLSGHFCEIDASLWATLRTRLVLSNRTRKEVPRCVKKWKDWDVPDGMIAQLLRECDGNLHHRHVADVTCESFGKEICGANWRPGHSVPILNAPRRIHLMWKPALVSLQLIAPVQKISGPHRFRIARRLVQRRLGHSLGPVQAFTT